MRVVITHPDLYHLRRTECFEVCDAATRNYVYPHLSGVSDSIPDPGTSQTGAHTSSGRAAPEKGVLRDEPRENPSED